MGKIAIVVHGGASLATPYLRKNKKGYEEGLRKAVSIGYSILQKGGSAIAAVEESVKYLEDDELFNAGRGSALNNKGEIEMDAAIMDGKRLKAGAVCMVRNVKNPVVLARLVLSKTKHVLLSGYGALELAKERDVILEPESYFLTDLQYQNYLLFNKDTSRKKILKNKMYGTVGAVALDLKGNLAAATSTGGTANKLPGRVGDSCIIGAGCYANNYTCAVSGTGEGEALMRHVIGHTVSSLIEFKRYSLEKACHSAIHDAKTKAHMGIIAVNQKGQICISCNTAIMKCGWMKSGQKEIEVRLFKKDLL